jgi:hypothetical protein
VAAHLEPYRWLKRMKMKTPQCEVVVVQKYPLSFVRGEPTECLCSAR